MGQNESVGDMFLSLTWSHLIDSQSNWVWVVLRILSPQSNHEAEKLVQPHPNVKKQQKKKKKEEKICFEWLNG